MRILRQARKSLWSQKAFLLLSRLSLSSIRELNGARYACALRYWQRVRDHTFSTTSITNRRHILGEPCLPWVRLGSRVTQSRLPLFPQQQTFLSPAVTSEKCQLRKSRTAACRFRIAGVGSLH